MNLSNTYKQIANKLAISLNKEGVHPSLLVNLFGLTQDRVDFSKFCSKSTERNDQIGIWRADNGNKKQEFIRIKESHDLMMQFDRWANTEKIPPKGQKKRVVLIGESVARGYFLDPYFTPSIVLETILNRKIPDAMEVIDLAANDLNITECIDLVNKSVMLQPDFLVLYIGNNLTSAAPYLMMQNAEYRHLSSCILRNEGISKFKEYIEGILVEFVSTSLNQMIECINKHQIPTVFVVPEFNLADWHDCNAIAPYLTQDINAKWWKTLMEAEEKYDQGDYAKTIELAEKLIEFDENTTAAGLDILAKCNRQLKKNDEARKYAIKARDARIWDFVNVSPRCFELVQNLLRNLKTNRIDVVDTPNLFLQNDNQSLPGKELFFDYCHLRPEGIQLVMTATAQAILQKMSINVNAKELQDNIKCDKQVKSVAHFLAAIHNAHWGQQPEIVEYHLQEAVNKSESTIDLMYDFLEIQGRRCQPFFGSGATSLFSNKYGDAMSRFFLRYNVRNLFDESLLDSIAKVLENNGKDANQRLKEIRINEWSFQGNNINSIDLLDIKKCPNYVDSLLYWKTPPTRLFYNAINVVSKFSFVMDTLDKCSIELVCRGARFLEQDNKQATLFLNGHRCEKFSISKEWELLNFDILKEHIQIGVNLLEFRWPLGKWEYKQSIAAHCDEMERGRWYGLTPSFAEISTLRVRSQQNGV